MSKRNDNQIFTKVFTVIKDLANVISEDKDTIIDLEIITTNGIKNIIRIDNNNIYEIKKNRNTIIIDKLALSLEDILKLKILYTNIDDEVKDAFLTAMENIITNEVTQEYKTRSYHRGNNTESNTLLKDKEIELYIQENKDSIKSISFNGIKSNDYINDIKHVENKEALSCDTSISTSRNNVIEDIDINIEKYNVISSIDEKKEKMIKDIDINEKFVLTNKSKEVEVAKPIEVESVNVLKDIHIEDYSVITSQSTTKVVGDMKNHELESIVDINLNYEKDIIGNIDKNINLINPKTVDMLFVEPVNKNINKEELKDRYLTFDPTGEHYIGVVLDDGTFEPLKVSMESITVVPNNIKNILINIDEDKNIINYMTKDIECSKDKFINSLEVEYKENVLEYNKNNAAQIKDIIKKSSIDINNVINKDETALVITKEETELIKGISDIQYESVSKIEKTDNVDVVKSAEISKIKNDVIEDIKLNKQKTKIVSNIEVNKEKVLTPFNEDIDGSIELVGGGVVVVNNNDSSITIYSTSKISTIQ